MMGMFLTAFLWSCLRDGYLFNIIACTKCREEELIIAAVGHERFKVMTTQIDHVYQLKTNNLYNYICFRKIYKQMVIK